MRKGIFFCLIVVSLVFLISGCTNQGPQKLELKSENIWILNSKLYDFGAGSCAELERTDTTVGSRDELPIQLDLNLKYPQEYDINTFGHSSFDCYYTVDDKKFKERSKWLGNQIISNRKILQEDGETFALFNMYEDHLLEVCCSINNFRVVSNEVCKSAIVRKLC